MKITMVAMVVVMSLGMVGAQSWTLPTMAGKWKGEVYVKAQNVRGMTKFTVFKTAVKGGVVMRGQTIWETATCKWEVVVSTVTATTISGTYRNLSGNCSSGGRMQATLTKKTNGKLLLNARNFETGSITPVSTGTFYRY